MLIFSGGSGTVTTMSTTAETTDSPAQIPLVDYLVLGDDPHLVANECTSCGARFFDRRNACASCFATEFRTVALATEGELRRSPSWPSPPRRAGALRRRRRRLRRHQRAGQRDQRRARPRARARSGMKVKLATYPIGTDGDGTEAIGFGFEPA